MNATIAISASNSKVASFHGNANIRDVEGFFRFDQNRSFEKFGRGTGTKWKNNRGQQRHEDTIPPAWQSRKQSEGKEKGRWEQTQKEREREREREKGKKVEGKDETRGGPHTDRKTHTHTYTYTETNVHTWRERDRDDPSSYCNAEVSILRHYRTVRDSSTRYFRDHAFQHEINLPTEAVFDLHSRCGQCVYIRRRPREPCVCIYLRFDTEAVSPFNLCSPSCPRSQPLCLR